MLLILHGVKPQQQQLLVTRTCSDDDSHACRCLRLGTYGLTIDGPIGHAWYKVLDKYVYPNDPQCNAAVLLKTAADQIAWAPIMTCVYFAFLRTLEGHPELIVSTIQVS